MHARTLLCKVNSVACGMFELQWSNCNTNDDVGPYCDYTSMSGVYDWTNDVASLARRNNNIPPTDNLIYGVTPFLALTPHTRPTLRPTHADFASTTMTLAHRTRPESSSVITYYEIVLEVQKK